MMPRGILGDQLLKAPLQSVLVIWRDHDDLAVSHMNLDRSIMKRPSRGDCRVSQPLLKASSTSFARQTQSKWPTTSDKATLGALHDLSVEAPGATTRNRKK
jgi:hypothetical protein